MGLRGRSPRRTLLAGALPRPARRHPQRSWPGAGTAAREAGQARAMLALRQLRCHDAALRAGCVWICENPVVIAAAADELGSRCPPLVCVGGQPSAAGWRLLDLLAADGSEFRYHGDFDWGGVRIASAVRDRTGQGRSRWHPWRYNRVAYETVATAVAAVPHQVVSCLGWRASPSRLPGMRAWRPRWRATTFAWRRNSPSTPCSRTWPNSRRHSGAASSGLPAGVPGFAACRGSVPRLSSRRCSTAGQRLTPG